MRDLRFLLSTDGLSGGGVAQTCRWLGAGEDGRRKDGDEFRAGGVADVIVVQGASSCRVGVGLIGGLISSGSWTMGW